MSYDVIEAETFWDCVRSLRQDDQYKGALMDTLVELREQPFRNPRLQTHDVGQALNGKKVYSSDVGGRRSDRRLVWQTFGETIVILLYGTHAVQDRAKRMEIKFDPAQKAYTVFERVEATQPAQPYREQRQTVGKLFMAWTDEELADFGFDDQVVPVLRECEDDDQFLDLADVMDPGDYERAYNLLTTGHPDGPEAAQAAEEAKGYQEADEPEVTDEDREIEEGLRDPIAGSLFTDSEPEFIRDVLSRPIEDWMVFLHPDQRAAVRRTYNGPARVRGSAGTGKTVVGLHRAAWLANQNRDDDGALPILFTTYIKSLPPVFESLFLRMPGTRAGDVEFVHIDRLANQLCRRCGDKVVTAPKLINDAFKEAHAGAVTGDSALGRSGLSAQYLRDEITAMIKGRGIDAIDDYLEVERTGRRVPFGRDFREEVWRLKEAWDAEMEARGTIDFPDVIRRARDHARNLDGPQFSSAIIDEAQDLTLVGLQLVRALVNGPAREDKQNGLMVLGDGAQRIYAGGFTLRQAGVEVRGRTTVLSTNYRNTAEIIGTAMAVAGDAEVEDLGESFRRGEEPAEAARSGSQPRLVQVADEADEMNALIDWVFRVVDDDRVGPGDVGILVPTNRQAKKILSRLRAERLACQNLDDYDGRPNQMVKVGTYHRGKGLEFKVVLLPRLSAEQFPRSAGEDVADSEVEEQLALAVSQLFVAMTRARDALVVFCAGEPSSVLAPHLDRFEVVGP